MKHKRLSPEGYLHHISADPLRGTPVHTVMMHYGLGDAQVTWYYKYKYTLQKHTNIQTQIQIQMLNSHNDNERANANITHTHIYTHTNCKM